MNKKFTRLALLITAILLTALCVLAVVNSYLNPLAETKPDASVQEVVLSPAEIGTVGFDFAPPTPTPESATLGLSMPAGAVDLVADGRAVFALTSEEQGRIVLEAYLAAAANAGEAEQVTGATLDCDVRFPVASGSVPLYGPNEAYALLLSEPALVPVLVTAVHRAYSAGEAGAVETGKDAALFYGARIVTQLGTSARICTETPVSYRGGVRTVTGEPVTRTVFAARATLLKTGAYKAAAPASDKERTSPLKGKDAGALRLQLPVKGTVAAYFGVRTVEEKLVTEEFRTTVTMQNGIDIAAKAGTAVYPPAGGIVVYAGERGAYGFVIDIDHGNGFVSRLAHCDGASLELNQRVFPADAIAVVAAAEKEQTPVLHWELLIDGVPFDPLVYVS